MILHCDYQKFSALIILLLMINVNRIQPGSVPNACLNYCFNGGACYKSNTSPKCICSPKWTGLRCDIPQNATFIEQVDATQADATDERNNQCTKIPADYCLHNGICYVDTNTNIYACYCRFPYTGDHCEELSECYGYCLNNGLCELDSNNLPICTCTPEWTGIRCGKLVTTTTASTIATTTTPSVLCIRLGLNYCNSGTCILVGGRPQCLCPPTFTGNQCNIPVIVTPSRPSTITPRTVTSPTTTTQGTRCQQQPCKNNGRCYPTGNSYFCLCAPRYTGDNCENPV